jgi:hypothetical protein
MAVRRIPKPGGARYEDEYRPRPQWKVGDQATDKVRGEVIMTSVDWDPSTRKWRYYSVPTTNDPPWCTIL